MASRSDPALYEKMGDWMAAEKQYGKAREMFRKALQVNPSKVNVARKLREVELLEKQEAVPPPRESNR